MTYDQLALDWDNSHSTLKCHTSGSTGKPADIFLPKRQMSRSAWRTIDFFSINSDSILYSCISPEFIGGKMMFVRARESGATLRYETPSNKPLENYRGPEITLLSIVPSQMIHILGNIEKLPRIKNILIGGSAIPSALRKRIAESGLSVWESYGMTETSSHIAIRRVTDPETPFHTLSGIRVASDEGALTIDIDGWDTFRTNDAAEIISPEEFMILGRLDNVIISGGKKIHPEQVEKSLSRYISSPFYISSLPDEKWGQRVILIAEKCNEHTADEIIHACSMLAKHETPKECYILQTLPRTQNGKIIRDSPVLPFPDANVIQIGN